MEKVRLHAHALERLTERGTTEEEACHRSARGKVSCQIRQNRFPPQFCFCAASGWAAGTRRSRWKPMWLNRWLAGDHGYCKILLKDGEPHHEANLRPSLQHRLSALPQKTAEVETLHLSDELNVDIAPDGTVYGIEMLNANQQLRAEDNGNLVVVNEALAQRQEIRLGEFTQAAL